MHVGIRGAEERSQVLQNRRGAGLLVAAQRSQQRAVGRRASRFQVGIEGLEVGRLCLHTVLQCAANGFDVRAKRLGVVSNGDRLRRKSGQEGAAFHRLEEPGHEICSFPETMPRGSLLPSAKPGYLGLCRRQSISSHIHMTKLTIYVDVDAGTSWTGYARREHVTWSLDRALISPYSVGGAQAASRLISIAGSLTRLTSRTLD